MLFTKDFDLRGFYDVQGEVLGGAEGHYLILSEKKFNVLGLKIRIMVHSRAFLGTTLGYQELDANHAMRVMGLGAGPLAPFGSATVHTRTSGVARSQNF